jgi:hypothetical protein
MAWLAALRFADGNSTGIKIEVVHFESGQLYRQPVSSAARTSGRGRDRVAAFYVGRPGC